MTKLAKTYWIIGASEGLGRSLAEKLSAEGCALVLSARSESRLRDIDVEDAQILPMDLTDQTSVDAALSALPDIDGVIYCAGAYDPMTAQDWDRDKGLFMMDVNVLGAMRVLPDIVSRFVAKDEGHIVLIGSLAAYHGLPGAVGYSTSKAALMHLAENLYLDLKSTKVRVQVTNPGFIETRLTQKNSFQMTQLMMPDVAADHVIRNMKRRKFRTAFPYPFAGVFRLLRLLPDSWVRRFF
ncbi:SDR family NAD(P)-dependent oxidoreductase [Cognatishimia activa]|uniref:SDR family NAD(P)-dependent oxidoreductase n=1 Tax=Cognatishimia activa TaxID=1715691 RepID=A0A975I8G2_9RHOB|nr:SDR family NAD(P)-dependent oxidoreductase [Cognatishimia activa]QTN37228.1 SDR family NAD(P)-dependent oxidoreductase [Cognatishimia activa]